MVRVELYQAGPGELTGFRAVGHAGYAPPGEDIVCAGVSALTQACVLGLKDHLHLPVVLKAEHGLLECRLPREIPEEAKAPARAILETMVLALREIEKEHGRYFALISLDAPRSSRSRRSSRRGRKGEAKQEAAEGAPAQAAAAPAQADAAPAQGQAVQPQAEPAPVQGAEPAAAAEQPAPAAPQPRASRRRRSRRRKARGQAAAQQAAAQATAAQAAPAPQAPEGAAGPAEAAPEPAVGPAEDTVETPGVEEPQPEQQVAVAQDPAEKQRRAAILSVLRRRRLRSFRPGRLGRRWRP